VNEDLDVTMDKQTPHGGDYPHGWQGGYLAFIQEELLSIH
jgi:hypothetical protein